MAKWAEDQVPTDLKRYGNRTIVKMFNQINALRKAIRSEGTPAVQEAWDKVEEHIDYIYSER